MKKRVNAYIIELNVGLQQKISSRKLPSTHGSQASLITTKYRTEKNITVIDIFMDFHRAKQDTEVPNNFMMPISLKKKIMIYRTMKRISYWMKDIENN
jgi:hypothetical protein